MKSQSIAIKDFHMPPVAYRPWTRWWWPGGDVEVAELRREVQLLAATFFGGAEIQPFVAGIDPATLSDPASAIYDYGSPAYYEKLAMVLQEADKQGIRIDLTVGSGWPAGGPFVPLESNPDTLLYGEATVTREVAMPVPPPIMPFAYALYSAGGVLRLLDHVAWVKTLAYHPQEARLIALVAAQITDDGRSPDPSVLTDTTELELGSAIDITGCVQDGYVTWTPPAPGAWRIVAMYTMPSGSRTLIGAVQGDSYAVDPFDSAAIRRFYADWLGGRPEILRHAGRTLRAVFSDSFEYFPQRHFADDLPRDVSRQPGL